MFDNSKVFINYCYLNLVQLNKKLEELRTNPSRRPKRRAEEIVDMIELANFPKMLKEG